MAGHGTDPTHLLLDPNGLGIEDLDAILRASRANNARDGVTGLLIVGERHFVQLLEGDRASVSRCFLWITQDPRHRDLEVISTGEVPQRLFAEQSMQRIDLASLKSASLGRYLFDDTFQPSWLPQAAVGQLCRELAAGDSPADPGRTVDEEAEVLERLRRLRSFDAFSTDPSSAHGSLTITGLIHVPQPLGCTKTLSRSV